MRTTVLIVIAAAAVLTACGAQSPRIGVPGPLNRDQPTSVRVQLRDNGRLVVREVAIEDYVAATILSEVAPPSADARVLERMFEVQAIISRSYALAVRGRHARDGFDFCSTTHCQLYEPGRVRTSRWTGLARDAVTRTDGRLLWFASGPARALFHADCGGHTSNAASVWGGTAPGYLAAERDAGPARTAHVAWTFEIRIAALRQALNRDPRTAIGKNLERVEIAARDSAGRAERVTLHGTRTLTIRGEVFREAVTRVLGAKTIRSTLFTVRPSRDRLVFTGRGFGHGVGLCQAGALARLRAGDSVENVLEFYFPGTQLGSRRR